MLTLLLAWLVAGLVACAFFSALFRGAAAFAAQAPLPPTRPVTADELPAPRGAEGDASVGVVLA